MGLRKVHFDIDKLLICHSEEISNNRDYVD